MKKKEFFLLGLLTIFCFSHSVLGIENTAGVDEESIVTKNVENPVGKPYFVNLMNQKILTALKSKSPKTSFSISLYAEPNTNSKKMGFLSIEVKGKKGIQYYYDLDNGRNTFLLDEIDYDSKNGEYFNHTILAAKPGWVLLPPNPMTSPAWAKFDGKVIPALKVGSVFVAKSKLQGINLLTKKIEEIAEDSVTVEEIKENSFVAHLENPKDYNCSGKTKFSDSTVVVGPVGSEKIKIIRYEFLYKNMYDSNQHFILATKYTKKCR